MAQYLVFQRVEGGVLAARRMARLVLWLMDLPRRGEHIGGGRHVNMPDSAPSPCPAVVWGWSTRYLPWFRHPANTGADTDRYAIEITDELRTAWLAKRSQLTAIQRNWVQAHVDSAADLAADWLNNGELDSSEDILPEPT